MTPIKICGLTRVKDVRACRDLGAKYLGFNFSARSPRRIDPERAGDLREAAGDAIKVGIFVDESPAEIRDAIFRMGLDAIQIHRELRPEDFEFGLPVIAVTRVTGADATLPAAPLLSRARFLLFDTGCADAPGGTGLSFDWSILANRRLPVPFGVAGGLRPENVAAAIRQTRPDVVDVASGVESAPGIKDAGRLAAFFEAVHGA